MSRKVAAGQILADIRSGMDDRQIAQKYELTNESLEVIYSKLIRSGALSEAEILNRSVRPATHDTSNRDVRQGARWHCPACHASQATEMAECPACGIVVAKYVARKKVGHPEGPQKLRAPETERHVTNTWVTVLEWIVFLAVIGTALAIKLMPGPITGSQMTDGAAAAIQARPHANQLAIHERATVETLDIQLQPLRDLNFRTQAEVLEMRNHAIAQYPQLISRKYRPSEGVFGQIVNGLPWWGVLGAFRYGRGNQSIAGPSRESQSILNPYLLVAADFNLRWDRDAIERTSPSNWHRDLFCTPQRMRWYPRAGRVEVHYEAACLQRNRVRTFSLVAYNAKDLNLPYIYVSYSRSRNIRHKTAPAVAYQNPQFLHAGGSCGYPGGCNNVSPATPFMDSIRITGWPCRVVVYLWERNPGTVDKLPDMEYIMQFD